jgi:hypothetical protein
LPDVSLAISTRVCHSEANHLEAEVTMFRALGLVSKKALLAVTWQAQTASNALRLRLFRESAEEISWYNKGSREGGRAEG